MFNAVPHHRLLLKLQLYEIKNRTHAWVTSWLTQRMHAETVVVDGTASTWLHVKSGVPQGTMNSPGPLTFPIYIIDISKDLLYVRLFAAYTK